MRCPCSYTQVALYGWVALGVAPPALVDALAARAVGLSTSWHPRGIASVLQSLALATPQPSAYAVTDSVRQDSRNRSSPGTQGGVENSLLTADPRPTSDRLAPGMDGGVHKPDARLKAMKALVAGVAPQVCSAWKGEGDRSEGRVS